MFNRAPISTLGVKRAPAATLRLFVIVLALLQLAAPLGAAMAEPAPTPVSHTDHLGSPDDRGCEPFHDDAFCLSCRVLFTEPLGCRSTAPPRPLSHDGLSDRRDPGTPLPDGRAGEPLRARAPPRV